MGNVRLHFNPSFLPSLQPASPTSIFPPLLPFAQTANEESYKGDGKTAKARKEEGEEGGGAEEEGRRKAKEKGLEEFREVS